MGLDGSEQVASHFPTQPVGVRMLQHGCHLGIAPEGIACTVLVVAMQLEVEHRHQIAADGGLQQGITHRHIELETLGKFFVNRNGMQHGLQKVFVAKHDGRLVEWLFLCLKMALLHPCADVLRLGVLGG